MKTALVAFILTGVALARTGEVNGFIRDASNGEPMAYANVYVAGTDHGAATTEQGYYYIGRVRPGTYDVVASYVGYQTMRQQVVVEAGRTTTIDINLKPGSVEMDEIVVSTEQARFEREVEVSATRLDTRRLYSLPRTGGEIDLLRTVQLLPGVVATSDLSNKLYIRGGSPDQNLILLDGITVYSPSHLFGMFSPFVPEAISDVTLLAGGFPAEYGGRLSSVLDITTKEGNSKRYTGEGSISLVSARALVEGPLPHGSFLAAGRRTYLSNLLLDAFGAEGINYYFYDVMGTANHAPNRDACVSLTGFLSEDVLDFWDPMESEDFGGRLSWGNSGVSLRWNHILKPVLYVNTTVTCSRMSSRLRLDFEEALKAYLSTDLSEFTVKSDFTWYVADRHTVSFGLDVRPDWLGMTVDFDTAHFATRDNLLPAALYIDDKWEVVPEKLLIKPGLRYSFYSNGNRHELEPRLGLKFKPGKNTALNASVGRYTQPIMILNSTDAVFSIYDVWLPVPADRSIPAAVHCIAGVEHWLRNDAFVRLEAYYKDYADLLEVQYGHFFTPPESLCVADGYSCGCDLMLRKTEGWATGWVAYSWMWTRRSIGQEVYHPHYDRRHNLNIVLNFPALFWGVNPSVKLMLGTGLPYAGAIGFSRRFEYLPSEERVGWRWEVIEGSRDAFRYPVYHRLDAGLTRTWNLHWGEISVFLDVMNVYNAKNVLLYYWESESHGVPRKKQIDMIPILPTLGLRVKF